METLYIKPAAGAVQSPFNEVGGPIGSGESLPHPDATMTQMIKLSHLFTSLPSTVV